MLRVPTETASSSLLARKKTEGFYRLVQQHRAQVLLLLQAPYTGRETVAKHYIYISHSVTAKLSPYLACTPESP